MCGGFNESSWVQHSDLQTISKIPDMPSQWGLSRSLRWIAGLTRSCSVTLVKPLVLFYGLKHANEQKLPYSRANNTIFNIVQVEKQTVLWSPPLQMTCVSNCVRSRFKQWSSFSFIALLIVSPRSLKDF